MTIRAIGLMTGSSMDGIDAVIMETDGKKMAKHIAGLSVTYDPFLRTTLRLAEYALQQELGNVELAKANFEHHKKSYLTADERPKFAKTTLDSVIYDLTMLHADLALKLLAKAGLTSQQIDVIGFHGQNLYHNPAKRITIQVSDGQLLADKTGCLVINNFRENDVKNGGQGAPFAPLYHQLLALNKKILPMAIVNCGGIANITFINGPNESDIIGFDTGPGNVLIDRYIRNKTKNSEFMDENGKYGQKGQINQEILAILSKKALNNYKNDFFAKKPPKSLDTSHFNLIDEVNTIKFEDACATLEAFTAKTIVDSIDLVESAPPTTWILAGGGWKNPIITKFLKQFLTEKIGKSVQIYHADQIGWSSQFMEAEIFAYLAVRSLYRLPLSLPNTTGVSEPTLGGQIYIPQNTNITEAASTAIKQFS